MAKSKNTAEAVDGIDPAQELASELVENTNTTEGTDAASEIKDDVLDGSSGGVGEVAESTETQETPLVATPEQLKQGLNQSVLLDNTVIVDTEIDKKIIENLQAENNDLRNANAVLFKEISDLKNQLQLVDVITDLNQEEKNQHAPIAAVSMVRDVDQYGEPGTAQVHPDEVANWQEYGWVISNDRS